MAQGNPITIRPRQIGIDIPVELRDVPVIAQDSINFHYWFGALSIRAGWRSLDTTTDNNNIIGLFSFQDAQGANQLIVATTANLYRYYKTTLAYDTKASLIGANPALTAYDTAAGRFAPIINVTASGFVFTNNKDQPVHWKTGDASWTVLTNAPTAARTVATVLGRTLFGNTTEGGTVYGSRVRWSALNDDTTYPAAAYADLIGTPDKVVDIRNFNRTTAVVLKEYSQWVGVSQAGSDAQAFSFEKVDAQPGPIGSNAVTDGPAQTIIYIGNDGNLYTFNGMNASILFPLAQSNLFFDPAHTENNCIVYDSRRNLLEMWLWINNPAVNTTNLVNVSVNPGTTGLVTVINNPGSFNLVFFGVLNVGYSYSFDTGQVYPLLLFSSNVTIQMRCIARLPNVEVPTIASGLNKYVSFNDGDNDLGLAITGKLNVKLPVMPSSDYEIDSVELFYDQFPSDVNIIVGIIGGSDESNLTEVDFTGVDIKNTGYYQKRPTIPPLRARYVKVSLQGMFNTQFKLRLMNVLQWARAKLSN